MANYTEKTKDNILIKIFKYLIPQKGDAVAEIIRKCIFLGAFIVLIVSVIMIMMDVQRDIIVEKVKGEVIELHTDISISAEKQEEIKEEHPEILDEFVQLIDKNPDIVGWIKIDGTVIDYPVMQSKDNDYYLDHNFYNQDNAAGEIFADYHDPIEPNDNANNIVLYGHNMPSGERFGMLPHYNNLRSGNNLDFYKEHPTIDFNTLYKDSKYKIFAGMLVNTDEEHGEVFYYLQGKNFKKKSSFDNYVADILDRSTFINPDVDLQYGDQLLTLSTCIFNYGIDDLRWVIFAREVRDGESEEVDVSKVYDNPDPLYFDYYYKIYGGEWGGRKWDASIIKNFSY